MATFQIEDVFYILGKGVTVVGFVKDGEIPEGM